MRDPQDGYVKIVSPRSIRSICDWSFDSFPSEPEEIADCAALKSHPWRFVVLAALADAIELAGAGATQVEIHRHVHAIIAAAEARLAGPPLQWGQA